MTTSSPFTLASLADLVGALDTADSPAAIAAIGVAHLRETTGARWAEIVSTTPTGGLATLGTADPVLTSELQHLRDTTAEPPAPGSPDLPATLLVHDLAAGSPWPAFAQAATAATPVRSASFVFSAVHDVPTVVPVYDDRPGFFTPDRAQYLQLASRLILLHLTRYRSADRSRNLQAALRTRGEIGIATGILSSLYGLGPDAAFQLLCTTSSHRNEKVREVARQVIDHGDLPPT